MPNDSISLGRATSNEAFTENISVKSKRGRPRSNYLDTLGGIYSGQSRRNLNNKQSMVAAVRVLKSNSAEGYFHSPSKARVTILAALGRIQNEETLLLVAREIAADKMPTSRALVFIRLLQTSQEAAL